MINLRRSVILLALASLFAPLAASAEPVRALNDLIGVRASSGEQALENRGFKYVGGQKSDGTSWTYYREPGSIRCVAVNTVHGKYTSIVYTAAKDCENVAQGPATPTAPAAKDDGSFDTVCGVILDNGDGQEYRYRCNLKNTGCDGSGQCKTRVKMPDNAYTIDWHSDGAIDVKFDGMNSMKSKSSFADGQTRFTLDDKVYFVYRSRDRGQRELGKL